VSPVDRRRVPNGPHSLLPALLLALVLGLASGCTRCSPGGGNGQEPAAGPRSTAGIAGPSAPASGAAAASGFSAGTTSVARFGDRTISAAELREALGIAQLLALRRTGNPLLTEQLGDKSFRRSLMLDLVDRRLVREEAHRLGLQPSAADRAEESARDPGDGSAAWRQLSTDRLLGRALARHLLGPLDEPALRREWQRQQEKIEVRLVRVPRTPTSEEVDRFLAEHAERVEAYFQDRRREFRRPVRRLVRYLRLPIPAGASEEQRSEVQRQAEKLRGQVLSGEAELTELVRRHSVHASRERDGLHGPVMRTELPAAFSVGIGQLSRVYTDLDGSYFVQVLEEEPPADRPLDDSLRREVAARAVVAEHANRHAWELAEAVRWGLLGQQPLGPVLQRHGLHLESTGLFPRLEGGSLPTVGLVPEELIDRLFAARPPVPPEPVQEVGADLLVLQLVRREEPDWQEFAAEAPRLPEKILARRAREVLTGWLAARPERKDVSIDYDALLAVTLPPDR